jgi:hypothetical protein
MTGVNLWSFHAHVLFTSPCHATRAACPRSLLHFPSIDIDSVALDRFLAGAPCLYIVSSAPIPSPNHWPAGTAIGAHTYVLLVSTATGAGRSIERARKNQQLIPHALFLQLRGTGVVERLSDGGESHGRRHANPRHPWRG